MPPSADVAGPKTDPVRLFAPAKLTLTLSVTGVREDGLHLIDAEMICLDFGDDLVVTPGSGITLTPDQANAEGVAGQLTQVPLGPDNLVARALALLGRDAAVEIIKRIPPGAGLGGGSADAAAILRWGGYNDVAAAAELGADIAFCLAGGRARVTGIGEIIEPLAFAPYELTLLSPPFGCNTAAVYRAWDQLGGPSGDHGNDLEPAALHVEPRLAEWRDRLGDATGLRPRLAGSGSTWFVEGAHEVAGAVIAHAIA